ncbi:MAG: hypothetical protein KDA80_23495 [Planctomycetaceae bacterium]|nr:hypothetical protein [Planctomycetaceae bacterium]
MSSPFAIFRKHQRVLMVVVTGFAMISFVLLGAVQDPRQMPTTLVILFLAAMAGGIAWMAGLRSGKASEYGLTGVLIGAILGLGVAFSTREAAAVQMDGGNLSVAEVSDLRRQRYLANQFIQAAVSRSAGQTNNPFLTYFAMQQFGFGFSSQDSITTTDVVFGEALRREADEMGLTIPEDVAWSYIKEATGERLTAEQFTEIRKQLQVSEAELIDALREEIKAKKTFELMYGRNFATPETYWDYHRQLNVNASAELVRIPVSAFVADGAEPSEAELQELFAMYRSNVPGFTPEGRRDEGRPGFAQPRRLQIGYLEAVYDAIEPLVDEPTEEEIQAEYEQRYLKSIPDAMDLPPSLELPPSLNLPLDAPELPLPGATEKMENAPAPGTPPGEPGREPQLPLPGETPEQPEAAPSNDSAPKESNKEEKPADETPSEDVPKDDKSSSSVLKLENLQFVAFQDDPAETDADAPAADSPQEEKPTAEEKPEPKADAEAPAEQPAPKESAEEKPATPEKPEDGSTPPSDATEKPVSDDKPSTEGKPAEDSDTEKPSDKDKAAESTEEMDVPPAPKSDVPPLDDALKAEIKEDLLRRKVQEEIRNRATKAYEFLSTIGYNVQLLPEDDGYLTREEATKKIEEYAEKNGLEYVVTPMLSQTELRDSEDYAIGRAFTSLGSPQLVSQSLFQTAVTDLYRVGQADSFGTGSGFAYWKLADKPAYIPETLEDGDYVKDQVIEVWKQTQAAPKAEERAKKLAEKVQQSDKPMAEVLSDETVTGAEDSLFLTIRDTGTFSWMQRSSAPPTNMMQTPQVRQSVVSGADDAGTRFFQTVFNQLEEGGAGVAPNDDNSAYYVIRLKDKNPDPSSEEEYKQLRQNFIDSGMPPTFAQMANEEIRQHSINWVERIFEKYNVVISAGAEG